MSKPLNNVALTSGLLGTWSLVWMVIVNANPATKVDVNGPGYVGLLMITGGPLFVGAVWGLLSLATWKNGERGRLFAALPLLIMVASFLAAKFSGSLYPFF